jgi:hypothetical protein
MGVALNTLIFSTCHNGANAMPLYGYQGRIEWAGNKKTTKEIADDVLRVVAAINRSYTPPSDCKTSGWFVADIEGTFYPVALDKYIDNFTNYVEHQICIYEDEPDPMGGYWIYCSLSLKPKSAENLGILKCFVCDGSPVRNHFEFEVGRSEMPPAPDRVNFSFYRDALVDGVSIWPADWANVRCSLWGADPAEASCDPTFPYSHYQMPWMSYLSAERAAKVKAPAGIVTERTPDGGLLMIAAETRLDPQNPEHMKGSRAIAEIMIEHAGKR